MTSDDFALFNLTCHGAALDTENCFDQVYARLKEHFVTTIFTAVLDRDCRSDKNASPNIANNARVGLHA
ncbi:uncharacterized protein JCM10292_004614 [Rhodotorula paludigena]|uniref:uncharacterized protein n=1 Tax=Rhodotorula paludigena TaxID=86838 RepID=UPI00316B7C7C